MAIHTLIRNNVRKLAVASGLYRPGSMSRMLSASYAEQARRDTEFYATLLPRGSLCFDVGANIGEKAEALLRAGMRVIAFEPQPECVRELRARCKKHARRLVVRECALGEQAGTLTLHTNENRALASFNGEWSHYDGSLSVPVMTLDAAVAAFGVPDFCKIDVEGWEWEVMKGLTQPVPMLSIEYVIRDRQIENTLACLRHLSRFGALHINIAPAETLAFDLPQWVPLEEFLARFPDEWRGREEYYYGDIFIRIATA